MLELPTMQVTAFSTPANPAWRWRIVSYAGETIAESPDGFPTIAAAVAKGTERLLELHLVDHSTPARYRSSSYRRGR